MEQFLIVAVGSVAVIVTLILASHHRTRAQASENRQRKAGATVALATLTGVVVLALAAYAGFSTLQWRNVQARLTQTVQAQIKEKALQHRAWVYAAPSLSGPMIIKGHGVSLATHYKVENTGDALAVEVEIVSAVIPHVEMDILAFQKALCEPLRPDKDVTSPTRDSLFPKQSLEVSRIEGVGADLVDGQIMRQGGSSLRFWWAGCVGYKSVDNPARHRTGFIYEIAAAGAGPQGLVPISVADQIIPKNRLVAIPYPGGGFSAD